MHYVHDAFLNFYTYCIHAQEFISDQLKTIFLNVIRLQTAFVEVLNNNKGPIDAI